MTIHRPRHELLARATLPRDQRRRITRRELADELERARQAAAQLHAEIARLRDELESTRAVAARLAGLRRSRATGADLVPVRPARVTEWAPPAPPRDDETT